MPDKSGLFTGPDQRTYAQIDSEGRFVVEQDLHGNYHLPLTFAPGVTGLALVPNEGQASWSIQRPDRPSIRRAPTTLASPDYLAPSDVNTLTKPQLATDGIRYNKLKQTFVTTVDGTVMVRKNKDGDYQQASAASHAAPEIFLNRSREPCSGGRKHPASSPQSPHHPADSRSPRPKSPSPARASGHGWRRLTNRQHGKHPAPRISIRRISGCPGAI
ncbi:hypothetical protein LJU32_13090 [Pseudomonas sp. B21_DOA]|nr:hypothetical protein LJU32_13090 [Pseudomonas sp. B21_DOA]